PSGCAIRAKIEKRGEAAVAAIKLTYTFRTTMPNTAISLGARRSFLVSASLDGNKLPILETMDEGFAASIESAGDHTVILDVECPVASRGAKPEIGFEMGLPRAAITTLLFEPPAGVTRVSLGTRTPDASQPLKPMETRRIVGLDAKALTAQPNRDPYPLGPVESLEVSWEPAAAPITDAVQSAEVDVVCLVAEGFVESTARFRPRGSARSWRFAAPADAMISVDRAPGSMLPDTGSIETPMATRPDPSKPIWKIDLPNGTTAADWQITAVVRSPRPKPTEPQHKGPFAVGPFVVLDVARQTGTVKVTTAANTRLVCKHGPELRQEALPMPISDEESAAFFRLATGPSGTVPPAVPLISVEAQPLAGKVVVRPTYKLTLTDAGWSVRAELHIVPIRTAIESVMIELPVGWRGPEVSPPELVDGSQQLKTDSPRQVLAVRLAAEQKQAFDLVLSATIPTTATARETAVFLPRFPNAAERDAVITASTSEGFEIRGTGHEWDGDQPAAWGQSLSAAPTPDGKPQRITTTITGKFERGLARLDLAWSQYRPPLSADVRVELVVHDKQIVVSERITLRSAEGLPRLIRFHGAADVKALPPFDSTGSGAWTYALVGDAKEALLKFEYPIPLPTVAANGGLTKVPIDLILPVEGSRTDSVVRVWM
ncbi:MAG TPA: hypothetical protein VGL71_07145, partial [Urbifossiella sp.]